MELKEVIDAINAMQRDGVIERYAGGGAVGATFCIELIATLDVDVFVNLTPGRTTVSPAPLFEYLKARGARVDVEYLAIAGWPVQFLPPTSALVEEALAETQELDVEGVPASVFSVEHRAAIALEAGRGGKLGDAASGGISTVSARRSDGISGSSPSLPRITEPMSGSLALAVGSERRLRRSCS